MIKPSVDYRQFRFSRLNTPEFSHVWLLLYWPLFGLGFSYVERFYPVAHYINMHCALDDLIPFNEWFLIPYMFWFVYLIGAVALRDDHLLGDAHYLFPLSHLSDAPA